MRTQTVRNGRSFCASADARDQAHVVDLEHAGELAQVQAQHRAGPVAALDPAHDRRAAAEGHHGHAFGAGPVEQCGDVLFGARVGDEVGGDGEVAAQGAHDVTEGLAVRVTDPCLNVHCAQMCQGGARPYRWFRQHQIGECRDRSEFTVERHQRPDPNRQGG